VNELTTEANSAAALQIPRGVDEAQHAEGRDITRWRSAERYNTQIEPYFDFTTRIRGGVQCDAEPILGLFNSFG
jgi:hypothetical protein